VAAAGDAGRAGDSVANATHDLYRQYGKQIYAYCLHQLHSREEAEDAVQTTFLNAFRGLQRGTTTRFEQAWLYKIAQNVCIARRSSSGRRLRLEAPDDFEILEEIVPSGSASAGDTLELMGLDDALEQMPENQRRAILLREWQGLSYREIAAQLDLSQGAVEMLIFRARKTLALALEEPAAAKRTSRGKAKTGFSFGSLIAAMKGLFSTGAALKMAAVAVSAAVVSTNAVHTVVHHAITHRHARAAAVSQTVAPARGTTAVGTTASMQLVSWRTHRTVAAPAGERAQRPAANVSSGPKPVVADDAGSAQPGATAPVDTAGQGASSSASDSVADAPRLVSASAPSAPVLPVGTSSGGGNPPSPPSGSGGSRGTGGSGGTGTGGNHHGHGDGGGSGSDGGSTDSGTTGKGNGNGNGNGHQHHHGDDGSTTTTDTTATTTETTTTTDTTTTSDSHDTPSSDDTSTTTTTTTDTSTTTTTTTTGTTGDGGSSPPASSGGNDHGHGGDNGGGGGGHGNGGGGGGDDGHHGHGH
jgi:RNA polymerase sigma factor (sigma-70 family)